MKDFKGTPGPWFVHDTYEDYQEDSGIIVWNGDEQAHKPICNMGEMGDLNYAEELANANLIAAAPQMMNALQEIRSIANSRGSETAKNRMIINEADAALEKAFGFNYGKKGVDNA